MTTAEQCLLNQENIIAMLRELLDIDNDKLLNMTEAAKYVGISIPTMRKLDIKKVIVSGRFYYRKCDLKEIRVQ